MKDIRQCGDWQDPAECGNNKTGIMRRMLLRQLSDRREKYVVENSRTVFAERVTRDGMKSRESSRAAYRRTRERTPTSSSSSSLRVNSVAEVRAIKWCTRSNQAGLDSLIVSLLAYSRDWNISVTLYVYRTRFDHSLSLSLSRTVQQSTSNTNRFE